MAKFRYCNTYLCYLCPGCFLEVAGKSNNYRFYLPNFLKFCGNISHKLLRPSQFLKKFIRNSGMVHFAEINQAPSPYSMLQHIGRVATPKLVTRNFLRYLQTALIMGGGRLVSEFMRGIVGEGSFILLIICEFSTKSP